MSWVVICVVACGASMLTFLSGFGLGTLLLPVFAFWFPLPVAIAATAVVHLVNNLFKLALIGRHAHPGLVLRFGVPAAIAAIAGAWWLLRLATWPALGSYEIGGRTFTVEPIGLVLGLLIAGFALLDLLPAASTLRFDRRFVALGGLLSGFFGGLSGHQGPLRAAFLSRCDLSPEAFVGTGVWCACLVDLVRLTVYGLGHFTTSWHTLRSDGGVGLVLAAILAAFAGAWVGRRQVRRMTRRSIHRLVGGMLLVLALVIGAGIV